MIHGTRPRWGSPGLSWWEAGAKEAENGTVASVMPRSGGAGQGATVLGDPPGTARAAGGLTVGVEEEFVLLDPPPVPLFWPPRVCCGCSAGSRGCSRN